MPHTDQQHNAAANDSYQTIAAREDSEIKIAGSRFLSYAIPCTEVDTFTTALEALRKEHYNATHHCFAWRIGYEGTEFRYSDDGEPGGTAGRRILGSIDRLGLTDLGIVVVRYFGGTKLGVGGLSRAYTDAADAVLARCAVERRYLTDTLLLDFPYDVTSQVHHVLETHGVDILDRAYLDATRYTVRVRRSLRARVLEELDTFTERRVTIVRQGEMTDG
jgi:uncharacterized YigZ family protein